MSDKQSTTATPTRERDSGQEIKRIRIKWMIVPVDQLGAVKYDPDQKEITITTRPVPGPGGFKGSDEHRISGVTFEEADEIFRSLDDSGAPSEVDKKRAKEKARLDAELKAAEDAKAKADAEEKAAAKSAKDKEKGDADDVEKLSTKPDDPDATKAEEKARGEAKAPASTTGPGSFKGGHGSTPAAHGKPGAGSSK